MANRPEGVPPPWLPFRWDLKENVSGVAAIRALHYGNADAEQQKLALTTILEEICGLYDLSYRPGVGGDRETAFAEGKRFVGSQIVKLTKLNINAINEALKNG